MNKFKVGQKVKIHSKHDGVVRYIDHGRHLLYAVEAAASGVVVAATPCKPFIGWWLSENDLSAYPVNDKIVIISDGNKTIARLYNDNKVVKSAEAKCSPSDTYDFAIGAKLAFERLMPSEPKQAVVEEKKTEDKHVYKVGDKVKVISNKCRHIGGKLHRVPVGTTTTVTRTYDNGNVDVEYEDQTIYPEHIEPYTEPTTPKKPTYYNGKVVCVEKRNDFTTKGKIYTFKDGHATDDQNYKLPRFTPVKSLSDLNEQLWSKFIEVVGEAL